MPFFVVARPHYAVACDVCRVGLELRGKRAHGVEGAGKALRRIADKGWLHDVDIAAGDAPSWLPGLGAGRRRCPACQQQPFPTLPTAERPLPPPPGLLVFLSANDGVVQWKQALRLRLARVDSAGHLPNPLSTVR